MPMRRIRPSGSGSSYVSLVRGIDVVPAVGDHEVPACRAVRLRPGTGHAVAKFAQAAGRDQLDEQCAMPVVRAACRRSIHASA